MILTADWHLDDRDENSYRWRIFDRIKDVADGRIFILGDLADRADRHSGKLVNQLVSGLSELTCAGNIVTILRGNHDTPATGPAYFTFLNNLPNIKFITEPTRDGDLLLLPYAANPEVEWQSIDFERYRGCFIHQTVTGATVRPGMIAESSRVPAFPDHLKVYAGDLHIPHQVRNVTYVGAPHAVRFGDTHRCRLLALDPNYDIAQQITLRRVQKRVIQVSSLDQLHNVVIPKDSQARIRFRLPSSRMEQWPVEQAAISAWAREKGVTLASVEAIIENGPDAEGQPHIFDADPERTLAAFCQAEGIAGDLYRAGLSFLHNQKGMP